MPKLDPRSQEILDGIFCEYGDLMEFLAQPPTDPMFHPDEDEP